MKVLTIGTFDPFGAQHADLLRWCRLLGDHVIVGVLSDEFVTAAKGKPTFHEKWRLEQFDTLVDKAYIEQGHMETLTHAMGVIEHRPNFLVVGSDWHEKDYLARLGLRQGALDRLGVAVVYTPRIGLSSTATKGVVREN